jgi:hypothetical protein
MTSCFAAMTGPLRGNDELLRSNDENDGMTK